MVTYYNRKDMMSFGSYITSEKRKASHVETFLVAKENGLNPLPVEETLAIVSRADIENWKEQSDKKVG